MLTLHKVFVSKKRRREERQLEIKAKDNEIDQEEKEMNEHMNLLREPLLSNNVSSK